MPSAEFSFCVALLKGIVIFAGGSKRRDARREGYAL
jgi:hypothetical protein